MSRCRHNSGNIQQFTEICLDCGHNVYETDAEYEDSLKREIQSLENTLRSKRIDLLENKKDELIKILNPEEDKDKYNTGW